MATRRVHRSDKPSIVGASIARAMPWLGFLCLLLNLFVVYRFETTRKPQVIYALRAGDPTNQVSSVSSDRKERTSSEADTDASVQRDFRHYPVTSNVVVTTTPYVYFLHARRRAAQIWGRFFSEGSLTSYGRIDTIFPDRIRLVDGSYIVNQTPAENPTQARLRESYHPKVFQNPKEAEDGHGSVVSANAH